ncbi:MAG: helicase-exonuclease AddAB subunit AddA [Lactococcus raffinolactis]|jgi:ATP-dependent helicase/nuclease subunit A|uniref:helicase-exonuclease AddAB subunit AddA n=1 Tax=Pseudolactococcus raffinolactis TaxID=1366 RepID=UPI0026568271|nr:helicase-exonuclease AddAB subunit AddA [Lactococcus raffinolactis]MDN5472499.1 helicase-exonuclease AddAB subunit AddA [Lactococcus raffinolactis]MDN5579560.1 helicase-exonuclease AddAB subunit AddA [Lactococcus raffinolactis]MDN6035775.1 helicase-exonuclease AddAB subunit AddA [Lactococcus raffinolactis]MDN6043908.1 helicase-exonuclease AddAB subunit AddA [Lactococcus raffinolactis]MDN6083011.1 helicase-exonuclease AddAB subunit AddA [Lactococcus raffinolactis]
MQQLSDQEIDLLQQAEIGKEMPKTPEQIEAIYRTGTNILVSASAGSGKTFVMTERIINLILNGVSLKNLFISTFTNKAAAELKLRLDKKIRETRAHERSFEEIHLLTTALQDLSTADIGTMDSFTLKFLKENFYLKNLDPTFRLLVDSTEQEVIKRDIFDQLVEEHLADQGIISQERFIQVMNNFSSDRKIDAFYSVLNKINTFADSLENPIDWLENDFLNGFSTYQSFTDLPDTFTNGLQESLQEIYRALLENLSSGVITGPAKINNTEEFLANFEYLYDCLGQKQFQKFAEFYRQMKFQFVPNANNKDNRDEVLEAQKLSLKTLITTNKARLDQFIEAIKHQDIIEKYHQPASALTHDLQVIALAFYQRYHDYKLKNACLEYADVTHLTIEILQENEVLRKVYQTQYFEVMVDEYQDTNHLQEAMLRLLSNGKNSFMVGDVKQSIYGFRLADPSLFMSKYEAYQQPDADGKLIRLKENFRSYPEIINFTNQIFEHLMDKKIGEMVYGPEEKLVVGNPKLAQETSPDLTAELLIYKDEKSVSSETDDAVSTDELVVTAQAIRQLLSKGTQPKDIVILVRSKTNNAEIERVLQSFDIPVVLDEGKMNYLQAMEVLVMLDVLRAIDNPLFDVSFVALLKSPLFDFSENDLAIISLQASNDVNFYDKYQKARCQNGLKADLIDTTLSVKLQNFENTFSKWCQLAHQESLHSLIWKIYRDTHYYDYVGGMKNGQLRQANLAALADRAATYESSGYKGLFQFIKMIDNFMDSKNDLAAVNIALPSDAVRVMTIHKSKGLEFPYVFILNVNKKFNTKDLSSDLILSRKNGAGISFLADFKKEIDTEFPFAMVKMTTLPQMANALEKEYQALAEEMRMLYVAFTRAVKKIYMVGKVDASKLDEDNQFIAYQTAAFNANGILDDTLRQSSQGYLNWVLGVYQATTVKKASGLKVRVVEDDDLKDMVPVDQKNQLSFETLIAESKQYDDAMATIEEVKLAKQILDSADKLNDKYTVGINLPTIQTPSQIKKRYEHLISEQDVVVSNHQKYSQFEFLKTDKKVSPTELGSAVHELMQSLDFSNVTRETLSQTIESLTVRDEVKQKIKVDQILSLFDTDFGQMMVTHHKSMTREAPFSMLKTDQASGEQYVIRGIIDGFIKLADKIILFDYKTDHFTNLEAIPEIKARYQMQMSLYAESLTTAFKQEKIEQYLILLGGPDKVYIEQL